MNTIFLYVLQLALTLITCLALTAYLRPALRRVLVDLCGTAERAEFWTAFTNVLLVALPVIFGLGFAPELLSATEGFFAVGRQLRANLFGFILALVCTGLTVSFFALVAPRAPHTEKAA